LNLSPPLSEVVPVKAGIKRHGRAEGGASLGDLQEAERWLAWRKRLISGTLEDADTFEPEKKIQGRGKG